MVVVWGFAEEGVEGLGAPEGDLVGLVALVVYMGGFGVGVWGGGEGEFGCGGIGCGWSGGGCVFVWFGSDVGGGVRGREGGGVGTNVLCGFLSGGRGGLGDAGRFV